MSLLSMWNVFHPTMHKMDERNSDWVFMPIIQVTSRILALNGYVWIHLASLDRRPNVSRALGRTRMRLGDGVEATLKAEQPFRLRLLRLLFAHPLHYHARARAGHIRVPRGLNGDYFQCLQVPASVETQLEP